MRSICTTTVSSFAECSAMFCGEHVQSRETGSNIWKVSMTMFGALSFGRLLCSRYKSAQKLILLCDFGRRGHSLNFLIFLPRLFMAGKISVKTNI